MGILGFLIEADGMKIEKYEICLLTLLNPAVQVVHIKNLFIHVARFKLHRTRQPKNQLVSYLTQTNFYGDAVLYAIDDQCQVICLQRLYDFLNAMADRMMHG
jgi:hypothetical protein